MKKFVCIILVIVTVLTLFAGCNRQIFDTTYAFDRAIIKLPNGEIVEGKVSSWCDYDGEAIQIVIDGVTYYTQTNNVVMIKE